LRSESGHGARLHFFAFFFATFFFAVFFAAFFFVAMLDLTSSRRPPSATVTRNIIIEYKDASLAVKMKNAMER
jgi:hypothetical protein